MIIDASAIVSILLGEPDGYDIYEKISAAEVRLTTPAAVWEVCVSVASRRAIPVVDAADRMKRLLTTLQIQIVAIPPEAGFMAVEAFDRFGKGRHPAALNFGDCLSYACSKVLKQPLLFKGEDFALTDVEAV